MIGFSEGFHDAAICVLDDAGKILYASHAERYSRIKNDKTLDKQSIDIALSYNEQCQDKTIHFYERPLLKKTRQFFAGQYKTARSKRQFSLKPDKFHAHHLSHAAATFQTSPFNGAACIVVDGIGEWDCTSVWTAYYKNGQAVYKKVYSERYPKSIGLWYSALTQWAGLKPNEDEYIFMGMGAYGDGCDSYDEVAALLLKNNHRGLPASLDKHPFDVAKSAEMVLYEKMRELVSIARRYSPNICLGGGVALNCVVNAKLQESNPKMWIMPNPGDAGAALGAAALGYGGKIDFQPYLGESIERRCDPVDVYRIIDKYGLCGVANGRAEFGPRALGNRSLLADPRTQEMKDKVNEIKRRQTFRPFAPAILEECAHEYFDIPKNSSPYMSYVYKCKKPELIPACVHADGTARVQTVPWNSPSILRKILEYWYDMTGCPVLLNTSLNIKGQPMVNTWEDALDFQKHYNVIVL